MNRFLIVVWTVLFVAVMAQPALCKEGDAAEAGQLAWKFRTDQEIGVKLDQNTEMVVSLFGSDITTLVKSTIWMTWKVAQVDDHGTAEMSSVLDRVTVQMDNPQLGKSAADTNANDEAAVGLSGEIVKAFRPLVGAAITFKMSAQGEVTDEKIPDDVEKLLEQTSSQGMPSVASAIMTIIHACPVFPTEAPKVGATWNESTEIEAGGKATAVLEKTYTYQGAKEIKSRTLHQIDVEVQTVLAERDDGPSVEIVEQSDAGTLYFDGVAGRLAGSNVIHTSKAIVKVAGQEVDQTTTAKTKVLFADIQKK